MVGFCVENKQKELEKFWIPILAKRPVVGREKKEEQSQVGGRVFELVVTGFWCKSG